MNNDETINISEFNDYIYSNIQVNNNYKNFLNKKFPDWKLFNTITDNDNIFFYDAKKLMFSIRFNKLTGQYKHVDIYVENNVRPYSRAILKNDSVIKFRYYEYDTWKKNYDVVVGNNFIPIYTIEYFNDGERRYIDLYFQKGKSFYTEDGFLKHLVNHSSGLKKLFLENDYSKIYKYMCDCLETDVELLFKDELFKDDNLFRQIFKQNDDHYSFYDNVIQESKLQPKYWSKVLMFLYRFRHYLNYDTHSKEFESVINSLYKRYVELFLNCSLSPKCSIGKGTKINHPFGIVIDSNVSIGTNCVLEHNITIENKNLKQDTMIGNNVHICHNSTVKNTKLIGSNSVIDVGAIITKNIPVNYNSFENDLV